ncbi:Zinc transporter 6, chloroplastic [Ancistrocladus abbreviatus]
MAACAAETTARELSCRDGAAAAHLKLVSIFIIFLTSVIGISSPVMLAKVFQGKPLYDKATLIIKCFAAGVILSTSLVHVLPDAFAALSDCQVSSHHPWKDFPFAGLITLFGALLALLVDLTASSHVDGHQHNHHHGKLSTHYAPIDSSAHGKHEHHKKRLGDYEYGVIEAVEDGKEKLEIGMARAGGGEGEAAVATAVATAEEMMKMKQRLVSQVLEIGIIFHSVIIGVTMGMSQNKCTIRPLVVALAFHQIFEGMGLGGCIAQAGFGLGTTAYMCFMFAVTTPLGIVLGMIVFAVTGYDDSSVNALIMEGLLGSLSSGILIYMALVDLISPDFFHNNKMMLSETWMKKACYVALLLGSFSMSILALWA